MAGTLKDSNLIAGRLLTVYPDHGPAEFKAISLPKLIATQRSQLRAILTQVVNSLKKEDAEHKTMFRDTKLASAFTTTTDYYFEKLYEAVHGRHPEFGHLHLKLLVEAIERFKAMLAERELAGAIDSIEYHLDLVGYPLEQLDMYFAAPSTSKLTGRDAFIFVHFVKHEFDALRTMAVEMDRDYQEDTDVNRPSFRTTPESAASRRATETRSPVVVPASRRRRNGPSA